tara:strand:- start:73 stop:279 length:207 start_codon:yes stop_codon:yes gene_type:complete
MKGLFIYDYDHYEWEYLVCVSESEGKLVERYHSLDDAGQLVMQYQEDLHSELADKEVAHLMIKEVEVL